MRCNSCEQSSLTERSGAILAPRFDDAVAILVYTFFREVLRLIYDFVCSLTRRAS